MAQMTPNKQLYDLLVSKNFDLKALDSRTGRTPVDEKGQPDIGNADQFSFDFVAESGRNYGTVVILLGNDNNLTMFFGDSVGKTMEGQDKDDWFNFLYQMKQFATKNFLTFNPENINKLAYTKQGQAAISEGLFESWQGKGAVSWNGSATEARIVIKHKKSLGEGEARFRYIDSIFLETADGERYKMKSRSLTAAKAMLEHVKQGGNPYDPRGQHINAIVEELSVLSRFRRASAGQIFEGETQNLVEQTDTYYRNMHSVLKHLGTARGYSNYFESWSPAEINEGNMVIEDLKDLFVKQTIDHRIEEALPILARITQEANTMKEAQIFESWINNLVEGTWALPETPEQKQQLIDIMSKDFPVGPDATNATEQLYDLIGDDELFDRLQELADADANADARSVVMTRMQELSAASPDVEAVLGQLQTTNPAEPETDQMAADVDGDEQLPQSMEEGIGGDMAKLLGIPVVAGAAAIGAQHYDDQQPHVEIGGQSAKIVRADSSRIPNNAMTLKGKDGKTYRVWQQSGKGMNKMTLAAPVDDVKEEQCNMTEAGEHCPKHGLEECGIYEYSGNWTNFGLEESDQLSQLKRLALGK